MNSRGVWGGVKKPSRDWGEPILGVAPDPHDLRNLCTKVEGGSVRFSDAAHDLREEKCVKTIVLYHKSDRDRPFRLHFGGVTLTISAACAQKLRGAVFVSQMQRKTSERKSVSKPLCFTTKATATGHSACILEG